MPGRLTIGSSGVGHTVVWSGFSSFASSFAFVPRVPAPTTLEQDITITVPARLFLEVYSDGSYGLAGDIGWELLASDGGWSVYTTEFVGDGHIQVDYNAAVGQWALRIVTVEVDGNNQFPALNDGIGSAATGGPVTLGPISPPPSNPFRLNIVNYFTDVSGDSGAANPDSDWTDGPLSSPFDSTFLLDTATIVTFNGMGMCMGWAAALEATP